jgi:serine/threonine-protein kinase
MSELIGSDLGPYRIEAPIGTGGMSAVYKAYHPTLECDVAIKVLPEHLGLDSDFRRRFQQEVRLIARLQHAHILPIYDYGQDKGRLYLVMRYTENGTLEDRMADGPLDLGEISRVMHQVGEALICAHDQGIVHRDVKPGNVLVDAHGNCFLSDFGLAKVLQDSMHLTVSGVGMGTPAYMSPEQGQGGKVDKRSDVYSLGVMLYEMVTGDVPFKGDAPMAVMLKQITDPPPPPSELRPGISPELEQMILKALAKEPAQRYQSVNEMLVALDAALGQVSQPLPPLRTPSRRDEQRLPPWALASIGIASIFVIVLVVISATGSWSRVYSYARGTPIPTAAGTVIAGSAVPTSTTAPSPTVTPSHTPLPPTATHTAVPTPTFTPTPTATTTATSTVPPTATSTATPTATVTQTATPTATSTATPRPTPTATQRWLPAPQLTAPVDGEIYVGWNANVTLRWAPVEGIGAGEYYVVSIPYDDVGGVAEFWRREPMLQLPRHLSRTDVGFEDRHYLWSVQVKRCTENCERVFDDNALKQGVAVGSQSAEGLFYWQSDIDNRSPTHTPTPDL